MLGRVSLGHSKGIRPLNSTDPFLVAPPNVAAGCTVFPSQGAVVAACAVLGLYAFGDVAAALDLSLGHCSSHGCLRSTPLVRKNSAVQPSTRCQRQYEIPQMVPISKLPLLSSLGSSCSSAHNQPAGSPRVADVAALMSSSQSETGGET